MPAGPRFGERLRAVFRQYIWPKWSHDVLVDLAVAIDQDAARLTADRDAWKEAANRWYGKAIRRVEPSDLRSKDGS